MRRKLKLLVVWAVCVLIINAVGIIVLSAPPTVKQPDLSVYVLTKPKKLFSVQYGKELSQVKMFIPPFGIEDAGDVAGPSDFAIGFDGNIYIGDEQSGKVKGFDRQGRFLMATEGRIDRIAAFTVDKQGRIYVIHGTLSNEVAVYDKSGKRLYDVEQKIMNAARKLERELASVSPLLKEKVFDFGGLPAGTVKCDGDGNLYFLGGKTTVRINSEFTRAQAFEERILPLLNEGSYFSYRFLPGKRLKRIVYGIDGSIVNQFLTNALERIQITVYKSDGIAVRKLQLPKREWSKIEQLAPMGGGEILCDGRGHFYIKRSPQIVLHLPLRSDNPGFFVVHYYGVFEYDEDGDFVGVRAIVNGPPCYMVSWFQVDTQGNIYWLDFKADHVDVMMAPVPQ